MGFQSLSSPGETVVVVMDANRNKGRMDALHWALNNVVRPKDAVVVLGILCEFGKKSSCLPFYMGIGISTIWERLEFSGHGEMTPTVLEEEIEKKREEYQHNLQPFYRQCNKNGVKLEVKLAAGFDPKIITVEEAQNSNTRWIVLDGHLKKEKAFIREHVDCNIATMKGKDLATIMPSRTAKYEGPARSTPMNNDSRAASASQPMRLQDRDLKFIKEKKEFPSTPPRPCWYPLAWRTGFPCKVTHPELERITNGFADEKIVFEEENLRVYQGVLLETPILIKSYTGNDERFWSELNILSRVHHRSILNLVGYCCTDLSLFLLFDYPSNGSLDKHLKCDELAKELPWKARWDVAIAIGGCLRYLHEECLDGPIVHLSLCSSHVLFTNGFSAMLADFSSSKRLKDDFPCDVASSFEEGPIECPKLEEDERLSLDVHGYGLLLLELVTGQRAYSFHAREEGQSLIDWALPLLEDGSINQVMDSRLIGLCDSKEVQLMAHAAFLCLKKNDSGHRSSISEVLAIVRGDRFGFSNWTSLKDHCSHF